MQAHKDKKGPNDVGVVFFFIFIYLFLLLRDTKAHGSQWRPIKTKKGPNDASGVVWALGVFFFHLFYFILITMRHESPRQPMTANKGQRRSAKAHSSQWRPTKANTGPQRQKGPKRRQTRRLGPRCVLFIFYFLFLLLWDSAHGMPLPHPLRKRDPGWIISQGMLIIH